MNTNDWEDYYGGVLQSMLLKPTSDHFPVLLEGGGSSIRGPLLFKFENIWFKVEGFKNLINDWWQSLIGERDGSYVLMEKLKP